MTLYAKLPRITWGTSFVNQINIAYPLDNWASYSQPREGSQWLQVESGAEDAWIIGTDYVLECDWRWIPTANTTTPLATGWDGTAGVRAFLEWARQKNEFRFYPDATSGTFYLSYLVDPMTGAHTTEPDGSQSLRLKIRNASAPYNGY